jgi:DNA-binding MarR family transcriptional regulator
MPDNATKEYSIPVLEGPSFTFARAYFTWKRITDRALEAVGLTHTQYVFMGTLFELEKHQDKATQNDLARLTNSDVTMTSQILRTLQKRGLVLREQIEGTIISAPRYLNLKQSLAGELRSLSNYQGI